MTTKKIIIGIFLSVNFLCYALTASATNTCPRDALKLGVCANLLGGLVGVAVGTTAPCCGLLAGLVDLEAALCLCTAIKANILGTIVNLDVPVALNLVLNACGMTNPPGFTCA